MLFTVTAKVTKDDDPQVLFAETEIFPPVIPATAEIELEDEEPVHPPGNVHVYEVAPGTSTMLYELELPPQTLEFPVIVTGVPGILFIFTVNV